MVKKVNLCPVPRTLTFSDGRYVFDRTGIIELDSAQLMPSALVMKRGVLESMRLRVSSGTETPCIRIEQDGTGGEEYTIDIDAHGIRIVCGGKTGAFRALSTLVQLITECGNTLPFLHIDDKPDFAVRGFMLDVARCRIPKLTTLYHIVDILASLKYNQLQLYMEGVPFEYPSFPEMCAGHELLTGEELFLLDRYCAEREIELVPCQNHFGHMAEWVEQGKKYNYLAESPDGFDDGKWGFKTPATLDPTDPRSLELVTRMADDLLPYFSSKQYNVNCDETNELGKGKSKELCDKVGKGRVYVDYILGLHKMAAQRGKRIMLWGDIIKKFPELLPELPDDVTLLEWGYNDDEPTAESCKTMRDSGVRFLVCPGTNSWNSIAGRNVTMINNIRTAAKNGLEYGAAGMLCTDWGDNGHFQPISVSYAGMVWAAMCSWNFAAADEEKIAPVLDSHIFNDKSGIMGSLVLDMGSYSEKEYKKLFNISFTANVLFQPFDKPNAIDGADSADFTRVLDYFAEIKKRLKAADMCGSEAVLVRGELETAIDMTAWAQVLGLYYAAKDKDDRNGMVCQLKRFTEDGERILSSYRVCWLKRNKYSYLDESLSKLVKLIADAKTRLKELED